MKSTQEEIEKKEKEEQAENNLNGDAAQVKFI